MKAHQVAAKEPESFDIAGQPCAECGRKLSAPWGRVSGGKWVCSKTCNDLHQHGMTHNVAKVRQLTVSE